MPEVAVRLKTRYGTIRHCCQPARPATAPLLLLLLLLLLLFELLLFQLILTLLLSFLGRLLLTCLDIGLVLRRVGLFLLEALLLLDAFLGLLRTLLMRLVQLALKVGLLLIVRLLVRRGLRRANPALRLIDRMLTLLVLIGLGIGAALRRFGVTLGLIDLMLTLLVLVSLRVTRILSGTLRRARLILRAFERRLLVTLTRALRALFAVECELLLANVGLHHAHAIACLAETIIHQKFAVAVVFRDRVAVVVFLSALVQDLLARVECVI